MPGACFNCSKTVHMGKECPEPKQVSNIRAMVTNLTKEETAELRKLLVMMNPSDNTSNASQMYF